MLCGSLYERIGWTAQVTQRTGDGGIDAIIQRGQVRKVLQCKRLSRGNVGVGPVRDLYGVIQSENAAGGILITTTGFTTGAVEWAAGKTIELIDAAALIALLRQHFPDSGSLPDALVEHQLTQERITKRIQEIKDIVNSPCPLGGKVMIIRKGKFGEFIGCSGYPACRHTSDIEPLSERRRRRGRKSKGGKRVSFRLD
jgi:restriction system protein